MMMKLPIQFLFFTPNTKHNTSMVYTFISALIPKIKCFIPELSKIYYYSDGWAGQYKNRSNFINLCYHKMDFDVECEWHFFSTSQGKRACDGIGGEVKKMTAKARLQRPFENQILTPQDMYIFCKENFGEKISFFYTSSEEIEKEKFLATKFQNAPLIIGTQKLHKIIPAGNGRVKNLSNIKC